MILASLFFFVGLFSIHGSSSSPDTSEASSLSTKPSNITTLGPMSTTDISNTTFSESPTPVVTTTTTGAPLTTKPPVAPEGSYNTSCIRADLAIGIAIEGQKEDSFYVFSDVYDDRSRCNISDNFQTLVLDHPNVVGIPEYSMTFFFEKNSTNTFVRNISFDYFNSQRIKENFTNDEVHFAVKNGNSYYCPTPLNITFGNVTMHIYSIRIQAFLPTNDNAFGPAESCPCVDCMSDLLAIAVACALGGIIILVLIAYLIGRRRSHQRGYLSV